MRIVLVLWSTDRQTRRSAYLQHARIQHAVRLLETVSDAIDQIRFRAGYTDPAAFRRVFKQATGLPPSRYRETYGLRNGPGK